MRLRILLVRHAISIALRRPARNLRISSDEQFAARNCFIAEFIVSEDELVRIGEIAPEGIGGLWFDSGRERGRKVSIPNSFMPNFTLRIQHYVDNTVREYNSASKFVCFQWLGVPSLLLRWNRMRQFYFNKRKLVRNDRFSVLRHIYEMTLNDRNYKASDVTLPVELLSLRWLYHPESRLSQHHYSLVLMSLHDSDDLGRRGNMYELGPKAMMTLAVHEEEDRRHRDNVRQQKFLVLLTFLLVITALKPPSWDLKVIWDWIVQWF